MIGAVAFGYDGEGSRSNNMQDGFMNKHVLCFCLDHVIAMLPHFTSKPIYINTVVLLYLLQ